MTDKQALRAELRARRREHADSLPEAVRALVLMRPPRPVADLIPAGASVGLYHAMGGEAPTGGYLISACLATGRHAGLAAADHIAASTG